MIESCIVSDASLLVPFPCLIAFNFLLRNVEVRSKQSLTSSEENEANSSAIFSISVTRVTNSSKESLTSSISWDVS